MQHDPAIIAALLAAAESGINRALALAPTAASDFDALAGTVVALEITSLEITVYTAVTATRAVRLMSHFEGHVTTQVSGSLEDLFALIVSDDPAALLINSPIEVHGNTAPLIALQQLLTSLEINWQQPLADIFGDVLGHQMALHLSAGINWGREAATSLRRQLSEYLLEEGRLTPPETELEDFFEGVQSLKLQAERLDSRIARLARRISQRGAG